MRGQRNPPLPAGVVAVRLPSSPPAGASINADHYAALKAAYESLPHRSQVILTRRFGLDGRPPQTLEQLGRAFDVTRERIRQIEGLALVTLHEAIGSQRTRRSDLTELLRTLRAAPQASRSR